MWRRTPGDARPSSSLHRRLIDDRQARRRSLPQHSNPIGRQVDGVPVTHSLGPSSSNPGESTSSGKIEAMDGGVRRRPISWRRKGRVGERARPQYRSPRACDADPKRRLRRRSGQRMKNHRRPLSGRRVKVVALLTVPKTTSGVESYNLEGILGYGSTSPTSLP